MHKQTKHTIDFTPDYNFSLYAIAGLLYDFQLSWEINRIFDISLKRVENIGDNVHNDEFIKPFSLYTCRNEEYGLDYSLFQNRTQKAEILIKDIPNVDYFFKIKGNRQYIDEDKLIKNLSDVKDIMMVYKIKYELLGTKNKTNFLGILLTF
ncbi:MAG: IPExxxVDY family protein [Bacteroidales bacterium]